MVVYQIPFLEILRFRCGGQHIPAGLPSPPPPLPKKNKKKNRKLKIWSSDIIIIIIIGFLINVQV